MKQIAFTVLDRCCDISSKKMKKILIILITVIVSTGCASAPPKNINNVCEIFKEREDWWEAASDMNEKWGTPIHVVMAMMYQ